MAHMFRRRVENPILTVADLPEEAGYYLLNPGAVKYNGEYLLLVDVFHREGGILFWIARSADGIHFRFDAEPPEWPACPDGWEENGCYDPRITGIDGEFFILYGSHNNVLGTRLGIVKTKDFERFERVSLASEINNRNGALFPEKIGGKYVRLDRPYSLGAPYEKSYAHMWISRSPDLVHWGEYRPLLKRDFSPWNNLKIGPTVPIKTEKGWLEIIHGVQNTFCGFRYSLGAILLDLENPEKIIGRMNDYLLTPEMEYEHNGVIPEVVFATGGVVDPATRKLSIYYGGADTTLNLATGNVDEIVEWCRKGE